MFKYLPFKHLLQILTRVTLPVKIMLGVFTLSFFLGYQPTFTFPPVRQNIARAQVRQEQNVNATQVPVKFQLPHLGYISTRFSWYHPGIDLATALGTPIHPVAAGKVVDQGYNFWGLGNMVVVDHGSGYSSLYAHMGRVYVKKGDTVEDGSVLGEVGLTGHTSGPHTHLQISKDGKDIDPLTVLPIIN